MPNDKSLNKPPKLLDSKELGISKESFLRLEDILQVFSEHIKISEQINDEEKTKLLQGISIITDTSKKIKTRLRKAGQPV